MKKYLLGIIAAFVIIGLSAFAVKHNASLKKPVSLHWYLTNDAGTTLVSHFGDGEKSVILETIGCDDDAGQPFCARGYVDAQDLGAAPMPSDGRILKTDETKH